MCVHYAAYTAQVSLNSLPFRFPSAITKWRSVNGASRRVTVCIPSIIVVPQYTNLYELDNSTPLGPCLVSAAAFPDPQTVGLKCILNGQTVQDGTTADQLFTVRETIAFLSQGTTLLPGSVIMTGTPKGVGWVKQPPLYLKNGDNVTVWVGGGIGSLVNPVIEEGKSAVKAKL